MSKTSLFLMIVLMTHSLFVSALANSHVSVEAHGQFEVPHIHVGQELTDDSQFHDLPGHNYVAGSADLSDGSEPEHDHEGIAHVHLSGDHSNLPFDLDALQVLENTDHNTFYSLSYIGLNYKPDVPPPNA